MIKSAGVAETGRDATCRLARHAATLRHGDLPRALIERTKQCVLDTLGVAIGASTLAPEGKIVADYVAEFCGRPESTILGFGGKAPAPWAAFVNGSLSHMLDFDGIGNGGHVNSAIVPVAFAVAEKQGVVSGSDLITAIAVGADLHIRIDQSVNLAGWEVAEGWLATQLFGFISGAATAGRLLGLNEEQMINAFGIAFNQLSGSRQMAVGTATHMRSMQAGFSGQAAVQAAEMARRGVIGSKEIIEGRYGLFRTYIRTDEPNWEAMVGGLGTRFPFLDPYAHGFKVWPACHYTSSTNTATLQLRQEFKLRPEDVETITIIGGSGATPLLFEPVELKRRPRTSIDAKYSLPFTTAVMMVKGNVTLHDYTGEGLRDPAVLAMAERVNYRTGKAATTPAEGKSGELGKTAGPPRHGSLMSRPTVEIRTRDGRILSHRADNVPGDGKLPVNQDFLEAKFRDCVSFSAKPIVAANVDRAIEMIGDLDNVSDVTDIVRLLA